jgi:hypothetical protein
LFERPLLPWQELGEGVLPFFIVDYLEPWQIAIVKGAKQNQSRLVVVDDLPAVVRQNIDKENMYVFFQDVPGMQNNFRSLSKLNDDLLRKNRQTGTYFWKKAKLITVEGSDYFPTDNKPGIWAYLAPTDRYQGFRTTLGGFWFDAKTRQLLKETPENTSKVQFFNTRLASGLLKNIPKSTVKDDEDFVMISTTGIGQTVQDDTDFSDFMHRTGAGAGGGLGSPIYPDNSTTVIYDDSDDDPVIDERYITKKTQNLARRKSDKYQRFLNKQARIRREIDDPVVVDPDPVVIQPDPVVIDPVVDDPYDDDDDDTYEPIIPIIEVPAVIEPTTPGTGIIPYKKGFSLARIENIPVPHIGKIRQKNAVTLQTQYAMGTTAIILMMILL